MKFKTAFLMIFMALTAFCGNPESDGDTMRKCTVSADFSHRAAGNIKPLHGVNNSPLNLKSPPTGFIEAGFPFCRLHDAAGLYGGTHYVDIPNVFPNFDADPTKPESYDFAFTDAYLKQLHASGTEIFYRLGVTIENNYRIKAYNIHPPKDFKKWAEICAGIIRHYNCGWANGFKYNIHYWEIWNEPENPPMWTGTREQYFELYRITSLRLKKEFPDIKVGGYGSCGFYAVNRKGCSDFYKSFLTWFDEFLKFVTAKETACPLDFFSWHLYTGKVEEIGIHAEYISKKLKEYGLKKVESIFDERNYISKKPGHRFLEMKDNEGASFVGAAFCLLQDAPVDKAMYYDAYPQRSYCGLYHFPGNRTTQTYSAFAMWNRLYRIGKRCKAEAEEGSGIRVCAAANGSEKALLIVNFNPAGCRLTLNLTGASLKDFTGWIIDKRHDNVQVALEREMTLPPYSVLLLDTKKTASGRIARKGVSAVHAGLDESGAKKRSKSGK